MTKKNIDSQKAIKDFVATFGLQNQYGIIDFHAEVRITIPRKTHTFQDCNVRVHFDYPHMGTLYFTDSAIDATSVPTKYIVDYNKFDFKDSKYLEITGIHPKHGRYNTQVHIPYKSDSDA
jgi:hypothetical protein